MCSTCAQAAVPSVSALSEQECGPSLSARSISTAAPSFERTGQTSPASTTFASSAQVDWVGLGESISYAQEFPASPIQSLASNSPPMTTARSGRLCAESLHSLDPLG